MSQVEIKVLDRNSEDALSGAHITYASMDGKGGKTVLTDKEGIAVIPSDFAKASSGIVLNIGYIGYSAVRDTIQDGSTFLYVLNKEEVVLNQVVITGQYSENSPEKSIHKIRIIDRAEMNSRGVVNLKDALSFENNIRIGQDNVLGSAASVQGISGQNVKIMVDGVPVIGRVDGNIDLGQINMNNVERIEVVEGPLSVNYGSNALAGTINIITKKTGKDRVNVSGNTYYESVGQYNIDGQIIYSAGKHSISASGGRNFFDGWSPNESYSFLPQSKPADTSRFLQWKPKGQYFGNLAYKYQFQKATVRVFADHFRESIISRGLPRAPYYMQAFDEYYRTTRNSGGLDAEGKNGKIGWSALAAYNTYARSRSTYIKDLTNLQEELSTNPSDHDTTVITAFMSRSAVRYLPEVSKISFEVGYDVNYETARGKRIEGNERFIGDYALYSTAEWRPSDNLSVKPGIRASYNTAYSAPIIPSLNTRLNTGKFTHRFSFARGFRAPSLKELYFQFVDINHDIQGNPDLKAEYSNNFQASSAFKHVKNQRIISFEGGVFYNEIKDMIALAQSGNNLTYNYINIGEFTSFGMDLNANASYNHWKLSIGGVYTARSNYKNHLNFFYSPEFRGILTYDLKRLDGSLTAFYKYNGRVPIYTSDDFGNTDQTIAEAYQMIDLTFNKHLFKRALTWSIGVKNLLDVQNLASSGSGGGIHNAQGSVPVSWGRSFFTSIKFNLAWK